MSKKEKAQETLNRLAEAFTSGDIVPRLAQIHRIKRHPGDFPPPSASWSMSNQIIMLFSNTTDARGYKQWQEAGRHVKAGAKAFYILAPRTIRKDKLRGEQAEAIAQRDSEGESEYICVGFLAVPVFRFEDTEGEEIPRFDYTPPDPPPLAEVAEAMGIPVEYVPGNDSGPNGYYQHSLLGGPGEIVLMTAECRTWFHELAHAAHDAIGLMVDRSKAQKETVAELSAAVLGEMYGMRDRHEHSAAYIQNWGGKDIGKAIAGVLADCERVLNYIFDRAEMLQPA